LLRPYEIALKYLMPGQYQAKYPRPGRRNKKLVEAYSRPSHAHRWFDQAMLPYQAVLSRKKGIKHALSQFTVEYFCTEERKFLHDIVSNLDLGTLVTMPQVTRHKADMLSGPG